MIESPIIFFCKIRASRIFMSICPITDRPGRSPINSAARNAWPRLRKVDEKFQPALRDREIGWILLGRRGQLTRGMHPRAIARSAIGGSRNTFFTPRPWIHAFTQVTSGIAASEALSRVDFAWSPRGSAVTALHCRASPIKEPSIKAPVNVIPRFHSQGKIHLHVSCIMYTIFPYITYFTLYHILFRYRRLR